VTGGEDERVQARPDSRLRAVDYYQILTTPLMGVLGVVVIVRSAAYHFPPPLPALLLGGAMIGYCAYRARAIIKFFMQRGS